MKHLISCSDFVLLPERFKEDSDTAVFKISNYAQFLKQPLTPGMFIPAKLVDGVWVILEKPKDYEKWLKAIELDEFNYWAEGWEDSREYHEALEIVLFKGFEIFEEKEGKDTHFYLYYKEISIMHKIHSFEWEVSTPFKIVEDLVKYKLELTDSAIKQIGL